MKSRVFPGLEIGSGGRNRGWLHGMRVCEMMEILLFDVFEYRLLVHFKIKFNLPYLVKQGVLSRKMFTAKSRIYKAQFRCVEVSRHVVDFIAVSSYLIIEITSKTTAFSHIPV